MYGDRLGSFSLSTVSRRVDHCGYRQKTTQILPNRSRRRIMGAWHSVSRRNANPRFPAQQGVPRGKSRRSRRGRYHVCHAAYSWAWLRVRRKRRSPSLSVCHCRGGVGHSEATLIETSTVLDSTDRGSVSSRAVSNANSPTLANRSCHRHRAAAVPRCGCVRGAAQTGPTSCPIRSGLVRAIE